MNIHSLVAVCSLFPLPGNLQLFHHYHQANLVSLANPTHPAEPSSDIIPQTSSLLYFLLTQPARVSHPLFVLPCTMNTSEPSHFSQAAVTACWSVSLIDP